MPRFVWRAELPRGRVVYVKAEADTGGEHALRLEAWAMERARQAGVPVAEMVALDDSERVFAGPVLVLAPAPGPPQKSAPPATKVSADANCSPITKLWFNDRCRQGTKTGARRGKSP